MFHFQTQKNERRRKYGKKDAAWFKKMTKFVRER